MKFLRNQAAWAILSVLLSGVWWLMAHSGGAAPAATAAPPPGDATLSLSTPALLTLASGETIRGTITGVQAICPSWTDALAAGDVTVTLPDGRQIPGSDVRSITATPVTLGGMTNLVNTTACGTALTVHAPP